jgi:two-component system response regulator MprA
VILDVMLPDLDGICVCTRLRRSLSVPVIMLSAKTSIPDRVAGLESGADDYVPKPFAFEELLARIDAILRRLSPDKRQVMVLGDLMLDARRREARLAGTLLDLTKREYQVLEFLMRHSRSVVREDTILEQVWGHDYEGESNVVEVFVRYLRRKLAKQGAPHLIRTVRGVGYMISD